MSCYITTDANGVVTRHFTDDATIGLTSANTGGAGYVPPACSQAHALAVPEPGTLVLLALGLVALGVRRAYRRAIRS